MPRLFQETIAYFAPFRHSLWGRCLVAVRRTGAVGLTTSRRDQLEAERH